MSSHLLESFNCSMSSYFRRIVLADCPGVFVGDFGRLICVCNVETNSVIFFSLIVLSFRERFFSYQTQPDCTFFHAWISQCISREGPAMFYNSSLALTYFVPQDDFPDRAWKDMSTVPIPQSQYNIFEFPSIINMIVRMNDIFTRNIRCKQKYKKS